MATPPRPPSPALAPVEDRRRQIAQVEELAGGLFKCSYHLTIAKAGETSVTVNFPVTYPEMPHCSSGGSLVPGSLLEDGNYPWCSVMVAEWVLDASGFYAGAVLALVLGGSENQEAVLHFAVEGKALQAPLG